MNPALVGTEHAVVLFFELDRLDRVEDEVRYITASAPATFSARGPWRLVPVSDTGAYAAAVRHVFERCGQLRSGPHVELLDPDRVLFNAGGRRMALRIVEFLTAN